MKRYISKKERKKCKQVKKAFKELYKMTDVVVMKCKKYGYIKLQYYREGCGFDTVKTFNDSKELFEDLWYEWYCTILLDLVEGTPVAEFDYDEIYKCISSENQKMIKDKKVYFKKKAGL